MTRAPVESGREDGVALPRPDERPMFTGRRDERLFRARQQLRWYLAREAGKDVSAAGAEEE